MTATAALAERVRGGDLRALARAISIIEDESADAAALVAALHPHAGRAKIVGVTGPPGAGKSTLVDRLAGVLRARGATVGVLAIDPSSPFTGGAILGDRVRMQGHAGDDGVFIRSMATRGHLGGLARATSEAIVALDAAGRDYVIVETVGVGQDEVDIVRTADVCVVTLVPGTGDDVQALKAGIMEIADVFVVNKADRDGADRLVAAIEGMLGLQAAAPAGWSPPVLKTEATSGVGVDALVEAVDRFLADPAGLLGRRRRARSAFRLRDMLASALMQRVTRVVTGDELDALADAINERTIDPYTAVARVLDKAMALTPRQLSSAPTLDHIGIAVASLDAALDFYRDALGLPASDVTAVPSERVRAAFLPVGDAALELLEATDPSSAIARSIERRGPGLHHITLLIDDLPAALEQLKSRGVRLVDESPRPGAHGTMVAFVHPAAAHGVLVELKQRPRPPGAS